MIYAVGSFPKSNCTSCFDRFSFFVCKIGLVYTTHAKDKLRRGADVVRASYLHVYRRHYVADCLRVRPSVRLRVLMSSDLW